MSICLPFLLDLKTPNSTEYYVKRRLKHSSCADGFHFLSAWSDEKQSLCARPYNVEIVNSNVTSDWVRGHDTDIWRLPGVTVSPFLPFKQRWDSLGHMINDMCLWSCFFPIILKMLRSHRCQLLPGRNLNSTNKCGAYFQTSDLLSTSQLISINSH